MLPFLNSGWLPRSIARLANHATRVAVAQNFTVLPCNRRSELRFVADNMERVLVDIDANHSDCSVESLGHGVLLVFDAFAGFNR